MNKDNTIGAVHAFVPFDVILPNGIGRGAWDVEWINASGVRGAGRALASHLRDNVDVYVGYGCNDLSASAFERMGMTLVPEIPRCVFVIDTDHVNAWNGDHASLEFSEPKRSTGAWKLFDGTKSISDSCLDRYHDVTPFGVSRSRAWLNWRYDLHPYINYAIINPNTFNDDGAAVVRIESVLGTTQKVARIVDLFRGATGFDAVIRSAIDFAIDQDCLLADYFCTDKVTCREILESSEAIGLKALENPNIPYMFQPLELAERTSINLVIARGGYSKMETMPLDIFHATKADSNQDMLRDPNRAAQPQPIDRGSLPI